MCVCVCVWCVCVCVVCLVCVYVCGLCFCGVCVCVFVYVCVCVCVCFWCVCVCVCVCVVCVVCVYVCGLCFCGVCVCCETDFSIGVSDWRGFRHEMKRHKATPNAIRRSVMHWREEGTVACIMISGRPSCVLREHGPSLGVLRPQSEATCKKAHSSVRHFWQECSAHPAVTGIFIHNNCKLCILWAIGTKSFAYKFVVIFRGYWLTIQTCRTNFWWEMRPIFIFIAQLSMLVSCKSSRTSPASPLWRKSYSLLCSLTQRCHWTLLLWG